MVFQFFLSRYLTDYDEKILCVVRHGYITL
jgi:hypothetical protein